MKYYIPLKTEKHFHFVVEADNIETAIKEAKDAASWYDFSNHDCFDAILSECREATESDIKNLREEFVLT